MSTPEFLTRCEAARVLRISKITLDRLIRSGGLPAIRIGRRVLLAKGAITALTDAGRAAA
ncbi:MAG: excisionase family DNA-binding protein [Rhodospirillaceae bacterium]